MADVLAEAPPVSPWSLWRCAAVEHDRNRARTERLGKGVNPHQEHPMSDLSSVKKHMEVIGADGVHVGTVDSVDDDRIKLTKKDSGSHSDHHHYISAGLVAEVEGDRVRLSANADSALLLEEEKGGEGIADHRA
jgi:hypothetical protein